jgi:short-subunit dehydrogenase
MGAPDLFFYVSGVGYQNRELDLDREIRTVQTNCEGMVRMVDHFVNYVRVHPEIYSDVHKAHVAVISSIAGTAGMGTAPAYSASKRMVQTYLSALVQLSRMEKIPVQFTDIRPGFVATDLLNPEKHYPMLLSKEKAADEVMKALRRKKRIHTFDWRFRLMVFGWKCIPRWLWERMTWVKN